MGQNFGHHERLGSTGTHCRLIPEIHKYAPHAQYIARRGEMGVKAGMVPMDTAAVCSEIQRSWTATTPHSGPKHMRRELHQAQEVVTRNEVLGSQRKSLI